MQQSSSQLHTIYLALGTNLGDRGARLRKAEERLRDAVVVERMSSVYETEPVGEVLEQRPFFNAVVRVETRLGPLALLDACKAVERAFGRTQAGEHGYVKDGPRPIDVDVLLLGAEEFSSKRLTLPHREVLTRRFVMVPLLELDPVLELPGRGLISDHLERLDGQDVETVYREAVRAVERVREGMPIFFLCDTHRLHGHYIGDPQVYRSKEDIEDAREHDPLERTRPQLDISDEEQDALEEEIREIVEASVEFAKNGTDPDPEDALKFVYA